MNNAFLRPLSPDTKSYFAAGRERILAYLEVAPRLAASLTSRCKKKKKKKGQKLTKTCRTPSPQPGTRDSSISHVSYVIVPLSGPGAEHRVSSS